MSLAASPPAQVFKRFGLLGTWSPDCTQPASIDNPRVSWRISGKAVVHTVSFDGRTVALRETVGTAEIVDDLSMVFTAIRNGQVALTVTVRLADDHVKTMRSVGADGHVYYDGAVERATGKPSLADERCIKLTS